MIIFLHGPDTYRSRQKLNEIIEHYKKIHKSGLNLRYLDRENLNFIDFKSEMETSSMLGEKKLIVLKDIFVNKDFQEEFLKQREKFVNSDNIILIYEKKKIDENAPFFKFLKGHSKSQEFELLEGQKLKNWVVKKFGKYQVQIDPKAIDEIINFVGNNLWQMESEIKKLVNYKNGPAAAKASAGKQKIEVKDVELLVRPKIETDIFKTIDAISEKKKSRALALLHQHLEKGDAPLYLLAMINFQFRNLLMIKSRQLGGEFYANYMEIPKELGLHPYVVKKTIQQARKFSLEELKKIYRKIFQVDLAIKTGKMEPEIALDMLIAEI